MSSAPYIVLADDLTGAAEIAAIAFQGGQRAVVLAPGQESTTDADVLVYNTDTRLDPPARAARRVRALGLALRERPHSGIFKKTDSVLRGPVLAEVQALAGALGLARTLLVPCNPSLGRIIHNGKYFIAGTPLHKTAFARDPLHPRRTSDVRRLLDPEKIEEIICRLPADRLPSTGVVVGEADTPGDITLWAGHVDDETLPAGGADFFRIWLHNQRADRRETTVHELPAGPALLLSGTATVTNPVTPLPGTLHSLDARHVPTAAKLTAEIKPTLEREQFASINVVGPLMRDERTPATLNRTFAGLAKKLHESGAFKHMLIAGGATAAAVLHALGWGELEVVRVWGPGVVTLQPLEAVGVLITLKPGSYAWPSSLRRQFESVIVSDHA